jgi:hypothetical protein
VGSDGSDAQLVAAALDELDVLIADSVLSVLQIAALYTILGQTEAAMDWMESPLAEGSLSLGLLGVDPALDPLRDDPRMQSLMDELGLPNGYDPAADTYQPSGAG